MKLKHDMGGDGITDDVDDDVDNDGMDTLYEVEHGIIHDGWQNPYIYNARYALLIGGGGIYPPWTPKPDPANDPYFWNDAVEFYNKLVNGYNYQSENVYLMSSKWLVKYAENDYRWEGHDKTTDAIVDGECQWENTTAFDIVDAIEEVGSKTTVNDFILLAVITHGAPEYFYVASEDLTPVGGVIIRGKNVYYTTLSEKINISWGNNIQTKRYSRVVAIVASCYSGDGAKILATGDQRIGIASSKVTELSYSTMGTNMHWAFLYQGKHMDGWYQVTLNDGFILSLGSISNTNNILYAFNKGYVAAKENRFDGNLIDAARDYTSHPMLEDYSGNGNTGTQGQLSPNSVSDEGWLAKHTYL